MIKSTTVRARVNPELKVEVEGILSRLGLTMSDAISLFMSLVKLIKGIPFDVKIPNKTTRKALDDSRQGKNLHRAQDIDDLFEQLDI